MESSGRDGIVVVARCCGEVLPRLVERDEEHIRASSGIHNTPSRTPNNRPLRMTPYAAMTSAREYMAWACSGTSPNGSMGDVAGNRASEGHRAVRRARREGGRDPIASRTFRPVPRAVDLGSQVPPRASAADGRPACRAGLQSAVVDSSANLATPDIARHRSREGVGPTLPQCLLVRRRLVAEVLRRATRSSECVTGPGRTDVKKVERLWSRNEEREVSLESPRKSSIIARRRLLIAVLRLSSTILWAISSSRMAQPGGINGNPCSIDLAICDRVPPTRAR